MKKTNKQNALWWSLLIAGTLSASVGKTLVYNIVYDKAFDNAYKTTYQSVYDSVHDKVRSETFNRGIKEKGYHVEWGPDYCTDLDLWHKAEKTAKETAEKTAIEVVETTASQKAQKAAAVPFPLGTFMLGLAGGLLAKKNERS